MKLYQVFAAEITTTADGWSSRHDIPTFYLDPSVQGITSDEQAERVARHILNPVGRELNLSISVGLVDVSD